MDSTDVSLQERVERHRKMADAYFAAYNRRAVKDGATYDDWRFAASDRNGRAAVPR